MVCEAQTTYRYPLVNVLVHNCFIHMRLRISSQKFITILHNDCARDSVPILDLTNGKKMNFKIGDHDHFVRREKTKNYNEFGAVVVMCVCAMCSKRQMELFRSCLVALRCGSATDWIECTNIRTSFLKIIDIENVRLLRDANATIPFRRGK